MTPSLAIPTDNIYKFACLSGLALVIASVISFMTVYTSTLDRKVHYSETIIALETKEQRSKTEADTLALNKALLRITQNNERFANLAIGALGGIGLAIGGLAALDWYRKVQVRDDEFVRLQMDKLRAEIRKMELETRAFETPNSSENSPDPAHPTPA